MTDLINWKYCKLATTLTENLNFYVEVYLGDVYNMIHITILKNLIEFSVGLTSQLLQ